MTFPDHFSSVAADYASFRPTYPDALFDWIASLCPRHDAAWDCATGSGQAAAGLARCFGEVIATDASRQQILAAADHDRVHYVRAHAEVPPLADRSVDAVTVAQALHWFDLDRFYAETARVLRPGAPLVVWTYGLFRTGDARVDALVDEYYRDIVGPYWPEERVHIDSAYAAFTLPGRRIDGPSFEMRVTWTPDRLLGFLATWSATRGYREATGTDPIAALRARMPEAGPLEVAWPLTVKASVPAAG